MLMLVSSRCAAIKTNATHVPCAAFSFYFFSFTLSLSLSLSLALCSLLDAVCVYSSPPSLSKWWKPSGFELC